MFGGIKNFDAHNPFIKDDELSSLINIVMVVEIKQCNYLFFFVDLIYQNKWPTYMNSSFVL